MNRLAAVVCRAALLLLAAACAAPARPQLREADYPGTLRRPEALPLDVVWQQHVRARWRDGQYGFDAAVQKQADALTVVGLSPTGSVGFSIVLRDGRIDVQDRMPEALPLPPRFVLLDVQRAFWPWLDAAGEDQRDGEREGVVDGERVQETWAAGRLQRRSFRRVDGKPEGSIVVRYEYRQPGWSAPTRVVLDNGWFGYQLEVDTATETRLDGGGR